MPELFFFILITYTFCFASFTVLFYFLHKKASHRSPFSRASEDTVDYLIKLPASWIFSAFYFIVLLFSFPIWILYRRK